METTAQFIARFNEVKFIATERNKVIGDYRGNKFGISISTNIPDSIMGDMAVQVVIRVDLNGAYAKTWGSASNDENMELVKWFKTIEAEARKAEYDQQRYEEQQARNLFDSL